MHDLQALGTAARLAEAAHAHAARESLLLLRGEIKESQRQKAGTVADSAEHLAPAAKRDLREQDLALDGRALARA